MSKDRQAGVAFPLDVAKGVVGLAVGALGTVAVVWTVIAIVEGDVVGALTGGAVFAVSAAVSVAGLLLVEVVRLRSAQVQTTVGVGHLLRQLSEEVARGRSDAARVARAVGALEKWLALPEKSRAILSKRAEPPAFREAVAEALASEQWNEAERLIEAMDETLGLASEARQLRAQCQQVRSAALERHGRQTVEGIRKLIELDRFIEADQALVAFRDRFPKDDRVTALSQAIREGRQRRRAVLLGQFEQACERLDVAAGLDTLGKLEHLAGDREFMDLRVRLTEVDHEVQLAMRDRFAELIKAKQWPEALAEADEILRQYPQAAMAEDIRKVYDQLVQHAQDGGDNAMHFPER